MVRPERDRICGELEVDETYVGGVEEGRRGGRLSDSTKAIVVGAVEIRGQGSGRVRLGVVEDLSAAPLVASSSNRWPRQRGTWQGYRSLVSKGYDHRRVTQGRGSS